MAFTKPNVNDVWANAGTSINPGTSKINLGWVVEIPDFEFENFVQNRQDQFNAHINQYGIAVWDSETEYQAGKSYVQGSDGLIYKAITTNTNQNPVSQPTHWGIAFDGAGTSYTKTESDNKYLQKTNNLSDVTNTATARTNLNVYSKTEADNKFLDETNNLSDLDDAPTARTNLGLGTAATRNIGTGASDVLEVSEADLRYINTSVGDDRWLNEDANLSDLPDVDEAKKNLGIFYPIWTSARELGIEHAISGGAGNVGMTTFKPVSTNFNYIAFIDSVNQELRTYSFNGSYWSQVGSSLTVAGTGLPALAALTNTDVAFIDSSNTELRTYNFDGSTWSQVGSSLTVAGTVGSCALTALNNTDVAFIDSVNQELRTYRFNGSTWSQVGSSLTLPASTGYSVAALSEFDVVTAGNGIEDFIEIRRFDGTNWTLVSKALYVNTGTTSITAFNGTDIAFTDFSFDSLRVYRFDFQITAMPYNIQITS